MKIVMNKKEQPFEVASTMGCRTYNGFDINFDEQYFIELLKKTADTGQLPQNYLFSGVQKDGRGNICPSTIILPTYAMEAKKKAEREGHPEYAVEYFLDLLEKAIIDTKDELIERFNWICAQPPASAQFMWDNNTMKGYESEKGLKSAMRHGTLGIGKIGIAEALQILIGKDHTSQEGMEVAKRIEKLYKDKCNEFKEQYHLNFGNYETPSESLCRTSYEKFTKKYKLIDGVNAYTDENGKLVPRGYFTNSIHVPVWKQMNPYEKIDVESQLTGYSSAGCITYVEIGDNAQENIPALEQIVLYAKSKDVPYFALNVLLSDCTACDYSGYVADEAPCPKCGAEHELINDYARVTGYLSTKVSHFNVGKQMEKKDRYVHVKKLSSWN